MATAKKKPAAKPKEPQIVSAAARTVTELLVWHANIWPHGASRAIDFYTDDGDHFRVCGISDEVAAQLVQMLTPAPPGPVVG